MAELGVLASLVGVVGAGLQLSVALFDFASTLGSAGREIEDMGYDITLLCAVLKRVQSTLDNPKSTRLSATAFRRLKTSWADAREFWMTSRAFSASFAKMVKVASISLQE